MPPTMNDYEAQVAAWVEKPSTAEKMKAAAIKAAEAAKRVREQAKVTPEQMREVITI